MVVIIIDIFITDEETESQKIDANCLRSQQVSSMSGFNPGCLIPEPHLLTPILCFLSFIMIANII